jgi:hypothetical protein
MRLLMNANLTINYTDSPFITVQLMTHDGDIHLLPRAVASVAAQDLDARQIELQIVHDGNVSPKGEKVLEGLKGAMPMMNLFVDPQKIGYYCVARNRALPHTWGFYVAHMDADNEWRPNHLSGLLVAMRVATDEGWPHFAYSRREYVRDEGAPDHLPVGPSPLIPWTEETRAGLKEPQGNFIDTGDFLISKSTLVYLAEKSGCVWNSELRRFGDWDLVARMAAIGLRGLPVDQISHIYHWHTGNLQITRQLQGQDTVTLPENVYARMKAQGFIQDDSGERNEA